MAFNNKRVQPENNLRSPVEGGRTPLAISTLSSIARGSTAPASEGLSTTQG